MYMYVNLLVHGHFSDFTSILPRMEKYKLVPRQTVGRLKVGRGQAEDRQVRSTSTRRQADGQQKVYRQKSSSLLACIIITTQSRQFLDGRQGQK